MGLNIYDIGDRVRVVGNFSLSDVATNPTTVVCRVRKPDGTVSAVTNTNADIGVFQAYIVIDQSGRWYYRFTGTGTVEATSEDSFLVRKRRVD